MKTKTAEQRFFENVQRAIAQFEREKVIQKMKKISIDKRGAEKIVITFNEYIKENKA